MQIALAATRRDVFGRRTKTLRRGAALPAVLYGHGTPTQALTVDARAFERTYTAAGETGLVDLAVDRAAPVKVLIQEVQRDPVRDRILHVDFHQVLLTEAVEADIPLAFVGGSLAVKELGGVLVKSLDQVKVRCLPGDLVPAIEVDASLLRTFDDAIHVRDLKLPKGMKVLEQPDEVVATVTPPRSEDELKALEEKVEAKVEEVEVISRKEEAPTEAAGPEETPPANA